MRFLATLALALVTLASPTADADDKVSWALLPARCSDPPPGDPTLLRLSKQIGEALHSVLDQRVRLVSREIRDDACPDLDGECPRDIAIYVQAERAVSMLLSTDHETLTLRVYKERDGLEREIELSCSWQAGATICDTEPLKGLLKSTDLPKIKKDEVAARFKAIQPQLEECKGQGWGSVPSVVRRKKVRILFRVDEHGRANEVLIAPKAVQLAPAYQCMARVVEGLKFEGSGKKLKKPFRFALPRI